ncbi:outer envelope membrane protein 7 [Cinnamomum micranthum f. kanehirae]|uniref:Outer envelope membrane protein 7 n=1 Tax=Cinnamomum micranthum f. kanehirae TaxID=337451 RepID=A0A3S3P307_9MAGN|nr:outer envelope membrane protein 7 [Cinnamomum micranthum f. kanehirae]
MGALTSAVIAIVGLALGWITIEIACKPCLDKGRDAIDRSLDPNYDPDDDVPQQQDNTTSTIDAPLLIPQQQQFHHPDAVPSQSPTPVTKVI